MNSFCGSLFRAHRSLHTISRDRVPSEFVKKRISEIVRNRQRKDKRKHQIFVEVPESKKWLDTATMPQTLTVIGTAICVKLALMWYDSHSQEITEQRILNAPEGQGSIRMLSREEWDAIQEVRPRTPFESKYARPNARIRTGEKLRWEDRRDWTIDILTDGLTRAEEIAKHRSS